MKRYLADSSWTVKPLSFGRRRLSRKVHLKRRQPSRSSSAGHGGRAALLIALPFAFIVSMVGSATAESNSTSNDARTESNPERMADRPAVSAANLRIGARYAYSHADRARSTFRSSPTTTNVLEIQEADFNAATLELTATIPLAHRFGLRGNVRGSYIDRDQDVDQFGLGNSRGSLSSYGVAADIFARDPDRGSLAIGSSYDRLDGEGGADANKVGASVDASIFFPDLGSGQVDWSFRFDYSYQEVSDQNDPTNSYTATAGAGWYLTNNSQFVLGGRWSRKENEFVTEEDLEGFVKIRWLLPAPIPMEFSLGGSAGVSDYKQSPFPEEDRLIYGASAGVTIRFRSGATLLEMIRGYD